MEPRNLTRLIVESLNEFNHIKKLQQFLDIALDGNLDIALDGNLDKMSLLVETYRSNVEPHLEQLGFNLNAIRSMVEDDD